MTAPDLPVLPPATALSARAHVEAVAIIRNLIAAMGPPSDAYMQDCRDAGEQWLAENHPTPEVYMAALRDA